MSSIQNELALFQPVPTEHAVNETKWVNFRPTSQISDTGPIEFNISPTSSYYVLLGKTVLNLKVKITKKGRNRYSNREHVCFKLSFVKLFSPV